MSPTFGVQAYSDLAMLFDYPDYAGYKPEVREAPNGDAAVDTGKRYLHVARKYNPPAWAEAYLALAHFQACKIAEQIGVPAEFYPRTEDSTLRVLEYPAGEGSAEHTDQSLFTVNLWRSTPEDHEQIIKRDPSAPGVGPDFVMRGAEPYHLGEIGELVGLGRAVPHRVPARPYVQRALVYFAIPLHGAVLPNTRGSRKCMNCKGSGIVAGPGEYTTERCSACVGGFGPATVGEWLAERMARSRVYR